MTIEIQPTLGELAAALENAKNCEALTRLKELRVLKTTWIGRDEHNLMFEIDAYIRNLDLLGETK